MAIERKKTPAKGGTKSRVRTKPKKTSVRKTPVSKSSSKVKILKSRKSDAKTTKKITPKKKNTFSNKIKTGNFKLTFPHSVSLAIIPALKLPVDLDVLAINTARFGGIAFVVIGAIFTLMNIQYIGASYGIAKVAVDVTQVASLCGSEDQECDTAHPPPDEVCDPNNSIYDQVLCDQYYGSNSTDSIYSTPDVTFDVDQTEPISGRVTIFYNVVDALEVHGFVYLKPDGPVTELGLATQMPGSTIWELLWDTTFSEFPNGEYRLKAEVTNVNNPDTTYQDSSLVYYIVQNESEPITTTAGGGAGTSTVDVTSASTTTATDDSTTTDVATSTDATTVQAYFELNSSESLFGLATIYIYAEGAQEVKFELHKTDYSYQDNLGNAIRITGTNRWKLRFDTLEYSDGEYIIKARIKDLNGDYIYESVEVVIFNNVETDSTSDDPVLTDDETADDVLEPDIRLSILKSSPIDGIVAFRIDTEGANYIELYATPRYSLQPQFLGIATQESSSRWLLRYDTNKLPNGEYGFFAKARNSYGFYETRTEFTKVFNEVLTTYTVDQIDSYETIDSLSTQVEPIVEEYSTDFLTTDTYADTTADAGLEADDGVLIDTTIKSLLIDFEDELNEELERLASAIRSGDPDAIERVKNRLRELRERIVREVSYMPEAQHLVEEIDQRLSEFMARLEEDTERTEAIIKDRVGDEITRDSDSDGITDYDEIHIYNTDPFVADTDGDGFNDGAEILSGYNPTDPNPEVLVTFESPREAGIIREDLLVVDSIRTVDLNPDDVALDGVKEIAVISGKGLPNSFVTLYIFSTPIIITVKTDSDGSWSYQFDKELEDGEHEIYVGVTDNAGRIVAKSKPFAFIKTAQAFTPVDAANEVAIAQTAENNSFASNNMVLLVLSISVVAIGLVLILLGLHLNGRKEYDLVEVVNSQETT